MKFHHRPFALPTTARAPRRAPRPLPVALAAATLLGGGAALADTRPSVLPTGLQVVAGQASVATAGTRMTVTNTSNAILNWQSFSIGQSNAVRFNQPSATSTVLNRVVGTDPSAILGQMSSNGRVWLLNPYGVLFGPNARIDVAGLVTSTLNINDADWLARRYALFSTPGTPADAAVVNQGALRTTGGGEVLLIGGAGGARNEGAIEASGGHILLAAGKSVELVDTALPNLAVKVTAPAGEALNLGSMVSAGGRIDLMAAVVNQQGIVRADGVGTGNGGRVVLTGSSGVTTGAASRTSADGASGGRVAVDAGDGTALLAGSIGAAGSRGTGGSVTLLGRNVGLLDGAVVDASGSSAGGAVRVGGGAHGQDPALRNAEAVYMDPNARIVADAGARGDGGSIVLWSDRATRAYGSLSARGGAAGGDGGFIETSGGWLDARPAAIRTDAPAGRAGRWLLDPSNVVITNDAQDSGIGGGPNFTPTSDTAVLSTATITAALNAGSNVSVTTASSGENDGDIKVTQADIKATPGSPVSLTLTADRNIVFDFANVRSDGAPLSLVLNPAQSDEGAVAIRSSTIVTAGGSINIGNASATDATGLRDGILVSASTLDAGSGVIRMTGHSSAQGGDASGIAIVEGSTLNARQISLTGSIDSSGNYFRTGVKLAGGPITATELIEVDGSATSNIYRDDTYPTGVDVLSELRVDPGPNGNDEAQLAIRGTVEEAARPAPIPGVPVTPRFGVGIRGGAGKLVAANGASLLVNGADLSPNGDYGVLAVGTAENFIDASSASSATLLASAGNMKISGQVLVPENATATFSADGALVIDGATMTGGASQVTLQADRVDVGTSGDSTQLVFGDETSVTIAANTFRIGQLSLTQGEGGAARPLAAPRHPLAVEPPSAQALIATGGPIEVFADVVQLGTGAVLHSESTGAAITLTGTGDPSNIDVFSNRAGAGALSAPNGRWLVFAADSDGASESVFDPGALRPAFSQYGALFGTPPAADGNAFLFASTATIGISGDIARTYDGTTAIDLQAMEASVTGLKSGNHLVSGVRFTDKNVGSEKPVVVAPGGATGIVDANGIPVYGYQVDSETMVGSISPRTLDLQAVSVSDKRYDGTTAATVRSWNLAGLVPGDDVRVNGGSASFTDPNVGSEKPVHASLQSIAGSDARNYVLGEATSATTSASITPVVLSYVADPKSITQGDPLPALTGNVTGFVNEETVASATTGTLAFTTPATSASDPGLYAINGSGLAAMNYTFVQAPRNATAFAIDAVPPSPPPSPPPPPPPPPQLPTSVIDQPVTNAIVAAVSMVTLPMEVSSPQAGRSLDAMQAVQTSPGGRTTFGDLQLSSMSRDAVATVLAAREQYKQALFSQAISALEKNPTLADAPGCATPDQAATGQCLMIAPETGSPISNARVVERDAMGTPGATAPTPAPAPGAAPPTPTPAPAPAGTTLTPDAALAALPEVTLRLPAHRQVTAAAVPQIVRKVAVVIGINEYRDERIPRLSGAVADARAVAASLERNLGYETLVLENPTRTTIFRTLNQLSQALGPADSVMLYYAGHGELVEKTGLGYWQPADADPTRPETWISNSDINRLLRQLPAQQVAVVSDSCFSGSLAGDERIRGVSAQDPTQLLQRRATVVMSSGGNEPVADAGQNGHSPFTNSLLASLDKVSTWKPGSSVFEQVRFEVARRLPQRPQYGASRAGGHESGTDYLFEQRQLGGVTR